MKQVSIFYLIISQSQRKLLSSPLAIWIRYLDFQTPEQPELRIQYINNIISVIYRYTTVFKYTVRVDSNPSMSRALCVSTPISVRYRPQRLFVALSTNRCEPEYHEKFITTYIIDHRPRQHYIIIYFSLHSSTVQFSFYYVGV